MKYLAVTMLLLAGCVSVSAGRPNSKEQQYPTWVQELSERRAEALEAAAEPEAEAEDDAEPVVARPLPTVRASTTVERPAKPAARKPRSEMNDREKYQEGARLLREANEKRQQAQRLMDEEEPRLNRERDELRRQRRR